jgi:DNA primase
MLAVQTSVGHTTDMDAVSEVKAKLAIEDIVGEYVQLKRAGRNYKGLSPFGNEKTPSFIVSPEKQIWHDFSSGRGGDVFSFVMEVEGLDFKQTLEHLARKAGVDLEQFATKSDSHAKDKEVLYAILELSTKFYQVQLKNSDIALQYAFKKRLFTREIVSLFRLGYSPNNGTALVDFLRKKGYTEDQVKKTGLASARGGRLFDMFRGRLMVPLCDSSGRVVGFTARLLVEDPKAPKYINTPATLLYDKGRQVYGLHLAKEAIRKQKFVVVVEGNLDVIASHQAGVTNVVAAAGTALTEYHLKDLKRFTGDIRFAFDSDRAGIAATERALPIAQKLNLNVSIITLQEGKDPDELIKKDPSLWVDAIANNQYSVDWLIERYTEQLDVASGPGKRQFTDILLATVQKLSDMVEREHYMNVIAKVLGVSKEALDGKLLSVQTEKTTHLKRVNVKKDVSEDTEKQEVKKYEQRFIALCMGYPALTSYANNFNKDFLTEQPAQEIFGLIGQDKDYPTSATSQKVLKKHVEYVKIITLLRDELYNDLENAERVTELNFLRQRLISYYVKRQKQMVSAKLQDADPGQQKILLEQDKKLNELLKSL